ncbi:MAG: hypothetical protein K2Q01_05080 [Rickettsiales bacterium]|nr:hypothetical protein [Rickettsiales bacterium]
MRCFYEGECYDVAEELARYFIRQRFAVGISGEVMPDRTGLGEPPRSPFLFRF